MPDTYKRLTLDLPDYRRPLLKSDEEALVLQDIQKLVRLLNNSGENLKHSLGDLDTCVASTQQRLGIETFK